MKKITIILIVCLGFSCKKERPSVEPDMEANPAISATMTALPAAAVKGSLNVKDQGAKGDGRTDDTKAIRNALIYAKAHGITSIYFPDGSYMVAELGNKGGIIKLVNGVGMQGNGPATCHIKLTGNRYNPNSIFYQDYQGEPSISNIVIQGIDFNGSSQNQKFDASYQFGHALSINNGKNIEVKNCKFENLRGDGLLFGDTFEPTLNARIVTNVSVHDSEFFNIYREGTMFSCVNGATFYNNNVHGNGYLVAGVDIERHSANETVLNVSVNSNNINSPMGNGVSFKNYSKIIAKANTITGTPLDGINIIGTSGVFDANTISDAGTTTKNASGIMISGNASGLIVSNNQAANTKTGASRTMDYTIKISSANNGAVAPKITNNKGKNMLKGIVSIYYYQAGYAVLTNNTAG